MQRTIAPINLTDDEIVALLTSDEGGQAHPEDLEGSSGYLGFDFESEVNTVADALYNGYHDHGFSFGFEASSDRTINGGTVSVYLDSPNLYLTRWVDLKNLTDDREATGTASYVAIARTLINTFNQVVAFALDKGLTR